MRKIGILTGGGDCPGLNAVIRGVVERCAKDDISVYGFSAGCGFTLAIVLFASVRERLEYAEYPKCFSGFPIALVAASLLSIAFMGFQGLSIF